MTERLPRPDQELPDTPHPDQGLPGSIPVAPGHHPGQLPGNRPMPEDRPDAEQLPVLPDEPLRPQPKR